MNKKEKNNKGFSLVELIIVIAIMAILVGVLAPQFIKFVEKSRESTDLQNIEEVKTAVETYVADTGDVSASTITINGNIACTLDKLSEYGVSASIPLKSSKWGTSGKWEYNTSTYSWTLTNASADYFDLTGSQIK